MATTEPDPLVASDAQIEALLDSFARRCEEGNAPDIEEYARQHPALAEWLKRLLPAMQFLAKARRDSGGDDDARRIGHDHKSRNRTRPAVRGSSFAAR